MVRIKVKVVTEKWRVMRTRRIATTGVGVLGKIDFADSPRGSRQGEIRSNAPIPLADVSIVSHERAACRFILIELNQLVLCISSMFGNGLLNCTTQPHSWFRNILIDTGRKFGCGQAEKQRNVCGVYVVVAERNSSDRRRSSHRKMKVVDEFWEGLVIMMILFVFIVPFSQVPKFLTMIHPETSPRIMGNNQISEMMIDSHHRPQGS
mmetsp:Transcript_20116/g.47057  ORF Transcript_20116/g.47057 Transcript_20116/m.47057 type:complete len:207 (+) Transcript_20116:180-800(+)